MRLAVLSLLLSLYSIASHAQEWETGVAGGYSWYGTAAVDAAPARAGYAPGFEFAALFADNEYKYVGGELQYALRFGGARLASGAVSERASGYSNTIVYNMLVHMRPAESKFRPFVGVGSGIRIYTNSHDVLYQPLARFAILRQGTQVEPAISVEAGVKYLLPHHAQLRFDVRGYTTPAPNALIRPVPPNRIRGWLWDVTPMLGIGYVF